jgi:hypothetical protein
MPVFSSMPRSLVPLLSIAGIAAGLLTLLVLPEQLKTPAPQASLSVPANCNLHNRSCSATAAEQQMTLDIKGPIRSASPMRFEVTLQNINADQVMLDLKGKEMFMGLNQVMMTRVEGSENRWQADVSLAVCTTGEMTWISSVIAEQNGHLTQADFEFIAQ